MAELWIKGEPLNYGWTFELKEIFLFIAKLWKYGWASFKKAFATKGLSIFHLELWVNFWIKGKQAIYSELLNYR